MGFLEVLKALFDIFSLAAILFFIYRFAVKRRAVRLVMGLVLFLLVTLFVDAVDLKALGFVFGDFRNLGVIALLIIFQPELRSALEKIGGTTFEGIQNINHGGDRPDATSERKVVEAIASAACDLSNINYGALIVIERESSLDEFKESGSFLDSAVTADSLKSIFYKGATLHDGAAIIKNGRIDYARCVLPMTARVDIPTELGTRHRAALGTTETTDAIVVIVSEESGVISLSIDGELERGFNYDSLCTRLEGLLNPARNAGTNNRGRKKNRKKKKKNTSTAKKADSQSDVAYNGDSNS